MKSDNKKTGNRGEELASEYLEKKGFIIEERNFSTRFGELDIVGWDGKTLVFVEVKTKIGHDFGEPEEMVNKKKLGQVRRMGEVYIEMNNLVSVMPDLIRHPEIYIDSGSRHDGQALLGMTNGGVRFLDSARNDVVKWGGLCRVDVVAIVLKENGEVEKLEHYEAVY